VFFCVLHNTQNCRIPCSHYSTAQKANKHNKLTQTPTKHRKPTPPAIYCLELQPLLLCIITFSKQRPPASHASSSEQQQQQQQQAVICIIIACIITCLLTEKRSHQPC
jgi:hypothetical protein